MKEKVEIKTVQTTRGTLEYYRDWENEGGICMVNPQTIKRYMEICKEHPDPSEHHCFFAFGQEQFDENLAIEIKKGAIKPDDKIVSFGAVGLYGTREGMKSFLEVYSGKDKKIAAECDPQEVYFYEYDNYECMIDFDGDERAIQKIVDIYGVETARKMVRFSAMVEV